ncbi:MAG: LptF/LptG family permease [Gemmatimonadota bacterium]|nr:LptF/LptG family permease [Gemmatimonadota bacterium]
MNHEFSNGTMRMGVLTRYLIRVHIGPFLFALSTLTALIFLNAVAQRIEGLLGKGLPWQVVVEFLALSLPHTIALSLPMSVLVAVLYSFSEMTASNEITAMSAGGIRPARLLLPMIVMGALMTGVMLYFNDVVLPESNHRLKNLMVDIGRKSPTLELREQIVNEIRTESGLDRYFLTAIRIDPVENTLENVTIFDGSRGVQRRTTYAARGEMVFNEEKTDLYLTLYDGVVHEVQTDQDASFQRLYFEKQIIALRGVGNELTLRYGGSERGDREMGFALLAENARSREEERDSILEDSREKTLETVRIALGRPTSEDSASVEDLLGARVRGQVGSLGNGESLLSRDAVTQGAVISSRTRATRAENLRQTAHRYQVEIHKKLAIAFACLVFTLIGPPLAMRFPRGGVGMVVLASSVIFSIYWTGLIGGEILADRRRADPWVTMWMANAVFFVVGMVLLRRMGHAGSTVRGGKLDDLLGNARDSLARVLTRRSERMAG